MNSGKTRSSLIGIVGAYLIYTAWQLFQGRNDPDTTMTPGIMILFIALFVLAGGALLVYAIRLWRAALREEKEGRDREDGDSIK